MSDIFLSYKSEDRVKAQKIAEAIEKKGYTVWWDRIIPPGRSFDEVIEEELDEAKCVVVLWSEKSIKAKWVKTEASEGDRRGILVPILIEDVRPPLAFRMMQAAKLMDWEGTSLHHEFDLLIQSVGIILGQLAPMDSRYFEQKQEEQEEKAEKEKEEQEYLHKEKEAKKRLQEQKEKETFINSISMKFVLIQPGEFDMGSPANETGRYDDEGPVQHVTISEAFYLGKYKVTQKQWHEVMEDNPSNFKGDDLPVETVSWDDVKEFIKKLNKKENTYKYRLPSEAEWEYAARAGTTTRYSFGDSDSKLGEYAWYRQNSSSKTHPVGKKGANPWGLYDIHGNVWEWVQDEWHGTYDGVPADGSAWEDGGSAWEDGGSAARVYRGGSWLSLAKRCRSAERFNSVQVYCSLSLGFRLLKEV